MASTAQQNAITLRGSSDIVSEFFHYGVNSILYQRGLYPPEMFQQEQKYGLTLLVNTDDKLKTYLDLVLAKLKEWLLDGRVQRLVLVVMDVDTAEVLERWQFNVHCDPDAKEKGKTSSKAKGDINSEIKAVIRQITASVTFLPLLDTTCCFDVLCYTDGDVEVPEEWAESGPRMIAQSEEVRLRSWSTGVHKVDAMVAYKS